MKYVAKNYPKQYRAEINKRINMLGNYKNITNKDARLIWDAGKILELDDSQIEFSLLCARTKPRKTKKREYEIYPQIYTYFAKIVNPKEKDPFKIIEEEDIEMVMTKIGKHNVNVQGRINAILNSSLDLRVLNGICESVKHGVRYPLELIYDLM